MRRSIFILLLLSCTNPKIEIVERQKSLKDSIAIAKSRIETFNDNLIKNERYMRIPDSLFQHELSIVEKENESLINFQREYDSLEFELKKY